MTRTFTFNRPVAMLLLLPLLILLGLSTTSLVMEFSWARLMAAVVTGLIFLGLLWLTSLRRLTLAQDGAIWRTPGNRIEVKYADVRSWGKVRYRNYQFLFLSKLEGNPFADQPVGSTSDTLVIQLRPAAWEILSKAMSTLHPELKSQELTHP